MSLCTVSHGRFHLLLFGRTAALLAAVLALSHISDAWAQQQTLTVAGRSPQQGKPMSSLGQALQPANFYFNARENGVLLSIDIRNDAEPQFLLTSQSPFGINQPIAPPEVSRGNRLPDIAERFNRRVVSSGSVTVLVPTMTTALTPRLPKPDIYADLSVGEKLRRLQSTLTPAQWRLLSSPGGLGESDLKSTQKPLFASLLPDPLFLARMHNENGKAVGVYEPNATPVVLNRAQRAGVRLTLYRTLSWWFSKTDPSSNRSGSMSIGLSSATGPDGTDTYALREKELMWRNASETSLFGATVKSVVPARVKPTDLDYTSMALAAPVSFANAKTVGELVERIQKATGVPVFCDPRYRDLTFVIRAEENQAVRAGDLLKSLAVGVCGTYRRVADKDQAAYVLTDDLEGLGTRQARIAEWAQDAAAQRQTGDAEVEAALNNVNIGDYVGWREGDPMAPTADLAQRIEDYRAGKVPRGVVQNPAKGEEAGLWVSVSDLPVSAQNMVKQQIESWNRSVEENQKRGDTGNQFYNGLLRTDKVHLNVQTGLVFLIPSIGQVSAGNLGNYDNRNDLLQTPANRGVPQPFATPKDPPSSAEPLNGFHWPQVGGTVRALLVPLPETEHAATEAASAAKAHGFNQLWVELPVKDGFQDRLTQSITAASKAGLRVQAVVHPTRHAASDTTGLARDLNMVGETLSAWAQRRAASVAAQTEPITESTRYLPEDYSRRELARSRDLERRAAARQKPWGDYLDIGDSSVQEAILAKVDALMQTPQLAGVVVRGFAAPGSAGSGVVYYGSGMRSVVEDFGYTPAQRLRFLLKNGVDPIDLSPLSSGQLVLPWGMVGQFGPPPSVNLPQMPDYSPNTQNTNGVSTFNTGAINAWPLWKTLRQESADTLWNRLRSRADAKAASVLLLREPDGSSVYENSEPARVTTIGTMDKPAPPPAAAIPPGDAKKPAVAAAPPTPEARIAAARENWHKRSSTAFLTFRYDPSEKGAAFYFGNESTEAQSKDPARQFYAVLRARLNPLKGGPDGLVIDLSELPLDTALPLLRDLPDEPIIPDPASDAPLSAKNLPK